MPGLRWLKIVCCAIVLVGALVLVARFLIQRSAPEPVVPGSPQLQVTTSFYPLYYFASRVAAEHAQVRNITPAGAEPHDYEPTPADIAQMYASDLLLIHGGQFEPWAGGIISELAGHQTRVVAVGERLATQQLILNDQPVLDPHVWLDPLLAMQEVEIIRAALTEIDPANAVSFRQNAALLTADLQTLDSAFRAGLNNCAQKDIVTSHAAFGYLAARYQFKQVAIAGLSPDAEPSAGDLAGIADFVRNNNIRHIFFESLVTPKLSQTIAAEVGAQTLVLNPLEGLTTLEQSAGKNYLSEMNNNLANLKTALQCP